MTIKNKPKLLVSSYFISLFLTGLAVTLLPWWPLYDFLIIPKYVLLFGPRWWLLLLCVIAFSFWLYASKFTRYLLVLTVLAALNYLDFQLPKLTQYFQPKYVANNSVKIINANVGGGGSMHEMKLLIEYERPDILLLQEAKNINLTEWNLPEYQASCSGGLCIISKLEFKIIGELNRSLIGRWGNFAMLYEIKTDKGNFSLANIHMETPRSVLTSLRHRSWEQLAAIKLESDREYEALLISSWQKSQKRTIIAGDFNMFEDENLYRKYFSSMGNALGNLAIGLNYTKKTSWYGARIDHLLFSDGFILVDAKVVDSIMGDHKPVVSTLYQIH